ncbi:hypothetical protein PIB30_059445 [Stylosanthes scabra]|uniref:TF-B3 domain-containing protein n=1 Tax=Stylosanthes scabra TaxID=79078 RepID=A0ABU6XKI9_9FABA|nr:hypothetical protein [Stylosanthes scabra]
MASNAVLFFKIILSKSLQQGILKLPKKFTRKYGDSLSKPVFLKPPDGTEWKVDWTMHDAQVLFQDGWREFVAYYSIKHGHFLMFEYNGNSHFGVQICDMSGLEIEYPFNVNQQEKDNIDEISDKAGQVFDEMPQRQNNRRKSPMSQLDQSNDNQSTSASVGKELDDETVEEDESEDDISIKDRKETKMSSNGALEEAEKFTSENPFFIITVTKKFLDQSRPNVPIDFVKRYLTKMQIAKVRFRKKLWPMKLLPYVTRKKSIRLSTGWNIFAKASKLQAGDVCIFELINMKDAEFDVHFFRCHP